MPGRLCATICATLLLLSTASLAQVQSKPETPKPKTDRGTTARDACNCKIFAAVTALLAASKTADAITTRQLLDRGGVELNPVFGRYPSPAKQAGVNAAFFAGQVLAFHFTEKNRRPWVRWLGRAYIGFTIEEHSRFAACNAGINVQAAQIQNCRPLVSGL